MSTLTQASAQWASRPDDERFTSLTEMFDQMRAWRRASRASVLRSNQLEAVALDAKRLAICGPAGIPYEPTHWAFGQLAGLVGAPTRYMRELPAPLAADCLTYGLKFKREAMDQGVLLRASEDGPGKFLAATGPQYGRIWNADIVRAMCERFGDGISGDWRVPGEFGVALDRVTKANTTLYASDRDMFVFLADETNRIEIPNRRAGKMGSFARGFFVWNSEVGSRSCGIAEFFFDYTCCNRMVWGATGYKEITIRHSLNGPERFMTEAVPLLNRLHNSSPQPMIDAIERARGAKIDELDAWLRQRKAPENWAAQMSARHMAEEERPVETVWDAATALTAMARDVNHADTRVDMERVAGRWLQGATGHRASPGYAKTLDLTTHEIDADEMGL